MKSQDAICNGMNVAYEQPMQIDKTAKIVDVIHGEVMEALGLAMNNHYGAKRDLSSISFITE